MESVRCIIEWLITLTDILTNQSFKNALNIIQLCSRLHNNLTNFIFHSMHVYMLLA